MANPEIIGDYVLPDPILVPIPIYEDLLAESEKDIDGLEQSEIDQIVYKSNILQELSGGH